MKPGVLDFLEYHSHNGLVVYEGKIETNKWLSKLVDVYAPSAESNYYFTDPRDPRANTIVRLELYWALSTLYNTNRKILVIEAKNTYFQLNPFINIGDYNLVKGRGELHIFGENPESSYSHFIGKHISLDHIAKVLPTEYAQKVLVGNDILQKNKVIYNPGVLLGHQGSLEIYLRGMITKFDDSSCLLFYCDWAVHNALWYFDFEVRGWPLKIDFVAHSQGNGIVNTLGIKSFQKMKDKKLIKNGVIYNWNYNVSPIVIHTDMYEELSALYFWKSARLMADFKDKMK